MRRFGFVRASLFALVGGLGIVSLPASFAAEPGAQPAPAAKVQEAAKVGLHWVEGKHLPGVTDAEGFQSSCDPDSIVYLHLKPALALTPELVTSVTRKSLDLSGSGLSTSNIMVTIELTDEARKTLAAACPDNETKMVAVVLNGRHWGIHRYEKDDNKPFVPDQARAKSFAPSCGFMPGNDAYEMVKVLSKPKE